MAECPSSPRRWPCRSGTAGSHPGAGEAGGEVPRGPSPARLPYLLPATAPSPTAHLVAVGIHGHEAQQVAHVAAAAQAAHELRPHTLVAKHALIARRRDQPLHANGAVLGWAQRGDGGLGAAGPDPRATKGIGPPPLWDPSVTRKRLLQVPISGIWLPHAPHPHRGLKELSKAKLY